MTSHLLDSFAKRALAASPRRSSSPPPPLLPDLDRDDRNAGPARRSGAPEPDCGFCMIASGQEPAHLVRSSSSCFSSPPSNAHGCLPRGQRVYDDEHVLAFLDILPIRPGHLLLVPRRHYERIPHLPDDLAAHLGRVLPRLCRALCRATGQPDHNLVSNQGYAQVVPHAHIHLVPAPTLSPSSSFSSSSSSSTAPAAPTTPPSFRRLLGREELDDAEGAELARRIREELRREEEGERAREREGGRAKL
ncbi:hypothetical protein JCM3775_001147 [Rhodotorula graminis]